MTQRLLETGPAERILVACNDIGDLELLAEGTSQMNLAWIKCMQDGRLKTQQTVDQNFAVLTPKGSVPDGHTSADAPAVPESPTRIVRI
jgi:hypothetical protein